MSWFNKAKEKIFNTSSRRSGGFNTKEALIIIEIYVILDRLADDWSENKYKDKLDTTNNDTAILYKFEDGKTVEVSDGYLIYNNLKEVKKFTFGRDVCEAILTNFSTIADQIKNGKAKERKRSFNHTKKDTYNTLLETIEIRKTQLSKMDFDDPDRKMLENELEVVNEKATSMKLKYNF